MEVQYFPSKIDHLNILNLFLIMQPETNLMN